MDLKGTFIYSVIFVFFLLLVLSTLLSLIIGEIYLILIITFLLILFFFVFVLSYLRIQQNIDRRYFRLSNKISKIIGENKASDLELKELISENIESNNRNFLQIADELKEEISRNAEINRGHISQVSNEIKNNLKTQEDFLNEIKNNLKRSEKIQDGLMDFFENLVNTLNEFRNHSEKNIEEVKKDLSMIVKLTKDRR